MMAKPARRSTRRPVPDGRATTSIGSEIAAPHTIDPA